MCDLHIRLYPTVYISIILSYSNRDSAYLQSFILLYFYDFQSNFTYFLRSITVFHQSYSGHIYTFYYRFLSCNYLFYTINHIYTIYIFCVILVTIIRSLLSFVLYNLVKFKYLFSQLCSMESTFSQSLLYAVLQLVLRYSNHIYACFLLCML